MEKIIRWPRRRAADGAGKIALRGDNWRTTRVCRTHNEQRHNNNNNNNNKISSPPVCRAMRRGLKTTETDATIRPRHRSRKFRCIYRVIHYKMYSGIRGRGPSYSVIVFHPPPPSLRRRPAPGADVPSKRERRGLRDARRRRRRNVLAEGERARGPQVRVRVLHKRTRYVLPRVLRAYNLIYSCSLIASGEKRNP